MISFRQLLPDDFMLFKRVRLEALELESDCYASDYDDWSSLTDEEWRSRLTEHPTFAAFAGQRPMALAGLMLDSRKKSRHRAEVIMVYVNNEYRTSGVASQLLRVVEEHACSLGLRQLELSANSENLRALRFYEREGYQHTGRIPDYVRIGPRYVDYALMFKRL